MREFKYFQYHTEYSCSGSFSKKLSVTPCFADLYHNVNNGSDINYEVHFYKGFEFQKRNAEGSACIVSKKQIISLLNSLNRINHFFFKVEEYVTDTGKYPYEKYVVKMRIKNAPAIFHKFVLSNLRCVYEFPHNLLLYDAFKLREMSPFKKENIFNLLNLTLSCCFDTLHDEHLPITGRSLHYSERITDLRKRIKKVKRVQSIYKILASGNKHLPFERPLDEISNCTVKDMEYWNRDFTERYRIYLDAYNIKKSALKHNKRN